MKIKCLSAVLITGAIALGSAPAIAETAEAPELSFSCQVIEGVPTTLAQPVGSEATMPIFHWKEEALTGYTPDTPQQLCDRATNKLVDYSAQGYDLSQISFVGTEQSNLPAICASAGNGECSKLLLTLAPRTDADIVAKNIVDSIIDKNIKESQPKPGPYEQSNDRGLQSTSYQVDFWSLFGLKSLVK